MAQAAAAIAAALVTVGGAVIALRTRFGQATNLTAEQAQAVRTAEDALHSAETALAVTVAALPPTRIRPRLAVPDPFRGDDRSQGYAFFARLRQLVQIDQPAYPRAADLHGLLLSVFDGPALDLYLLAPVIVTAPDPVDGIAALALVEPALRRIETSFAVQAVERTATSAHDYNRIYQGTDSFGEFLGKFLSSAYGSGRATQVPTDAFPNVGLLLDLQRKTRRELTDRVLTCYGIGATWEQFVTGALAFDPNTPRPVRVPQQTRSTPFAGTGKRNTRMVAPFVHAKAPYETLASQAKWTWPADVPVNLRGRLTPALRVQLAEANRCFFCRRGGHIATNCPEKRSAYIGPMEQGPEFGGNVPGDIAAFYSSPADNGIEGVNSPFYSRAGIINQSVDPSRVAPNDQSGTYSVPSLD